jgi:monoamine oxidase
MQTTVAIIEGGLAGLYAGKLLQAVGVDFRVVEARERLGGRILSTDAEGTPSEDGFDLGPSWFWPHVQPQLASLVQELGLATFPQHNNGDVVIERMSRETPWRYRATLGRQRRCRTGDCGCSSTVACTDRRVPSRRCRDNATLA